MFTTETGIGVVVMVVFAVFWLAFMLWEDWGQAGKTARARASAKANGWEQDEMQNTITRNGAIIAYRLMTCLLYTSTPRKGKAVSGYRRRDSGAGSRGLNCTCLLYTSRCV